MALHLFSKTPSDYFPPLSWGHRITGASLRADLFAGFTNAAIVLPQAIAFAAIAGLPPEYGLYTAMVPAIFAALFGSSMIMVSGPTTAISAVVFSALSGTFEIGSPEFISAAILMTILVGLIQLLLGIARAGKLAGFVSHSVMLGFTMAAAVLIFVAQIKDALGLDVQVAGSVFERLATIGLHLGETDWHAASIAGATAATAYGIGHLDRRLPAFLIALVVGTLVSLTYDYPVKTIGEIEAILPKLTLPDFSFSNLISLLESAFAVALIGLLEAIAIARSFAPRTGVKFNANQEIIGQGVANLAGGLFQAYPSSGSFTRSGVNYESGAKTPLSAVFAGLILIAILFAVAPFAAYVPISAMAGLIFIVAIRLIQRREVLHIVDTSVGETFILIATFLTGVLIELELALLLGVLLSFGFFVYRTTKPRLGIEAPDPTLSGRGFRSAELFGLPECPQMAIGRFDGPLYFGSAEYLEQEFQRLREERPEQKVLILNLKGTGDVDLAGVDAIIEESRHRNNIGGGLYVIARNVDFITRLEKLGLIQGISGSHLFENKNDAIGILVPRLDKDICRNCPLPIFKECARNGASPVPG